MSFSDISYCFEYMIKHFFDVDNKQSTDKTYNTSMDKTKKTSSPWLQKQRSVERRVAVYHGKKKLFANQFSVGERQATIARLFFKYTHKGGLQNIHICFKVS